MHPARCQVCSLQASIILLPSLILTGLLFHRPVAAQGEWRAAVDTRRRPHSHCCHRVRKQLCSLRGATQAAHRAHCRVGVLALPYSFSHLTWGAGPLLLVFTCLTNLYTSFILAAMHQTETGARYNSYPELGRGLLGASLHPARACCLIMLHLQSCGVVQGHGWASGLSCPSSSAVS